MNEHEKDTRAREHERDLTVLDAAGVVASRTTGDLVVDLSGIQKLDLTTLALLLTAQQKAEEEDRDVWLAGLPLRLWQALNAMGLGQLFRPFPLSGAMVD